MLELTVSLNVAKNLFKNGVEVLNANEIASKYLSSAETANIYATTKQVNALIQGLIGLTCKVVKELPQIGQINTLYLLKIPSLEHWYDQYLYIDNQWYPLGNTMVNLDEYISKSDADFTERPTVNGVEVALVTDLIDSVPDATTEVKGIVRISCDHVIPYDQATPIGYDEGGQIVAKVHKASQEQPGVVMFTSLGVNADETDKALAPKDVHEYVGDLNDLATMDKSSIVNAINDIRKSDAKRYYFENTELATESGEAGEVSWVIDFGVKVHDVSAIRLVELSSGDTVYADENVSGSVLTIKMQAPEGKIAENSYGLMLTGF